MFFINPFILSPAGGDFESIATVTVGSGGAANIEFTSIPGTYQHLQVRGIVRSDRADSNENVRYQLNASTSSNYAYHALRGDGSAAVAEAGSSQAQMELDRTIAGANATASVFGGFVMDILDYSLSSKATTTRTLGGYDNNGSGQVVLSSGLWTVTDAVTSVKFFPRFGTNFVQHSTLALYGVKAP
jgi:hypothetical protein